MFDQGIGGAIPLHTLGIDLTRIFTAGGLFAVAIAFAMNKAQAAFAKP